MKPSSRSAEKPPSAELKVNLVAWAPESEPPVVTAFLKRPAIDAQADTLAKQVLSDVKARGDAAVLECVRQFDGLTLQADQLRVTRAEFNEARDRVDTEFIRAAREAHRRVAAFAKAGMKKDWSMTTAKGGMVGEQFVPFDRVGVYVPGGAAPLISTALMTVTLAKTAGVPEIAVCTPSAVSPAMNPFLLFCLELAGATEVYKIGGIQAIGALAYGTATIRKVQKIVGPGGQYVTAAKRCVYGDVALDLVAGPSEIAILADDTALPENIAADLLSQAEHGTGLEKALLATSSAQLAIAVQNELIRQAATLERQDAIRKVLAEGALLVVVNHLDAGIELCNRFAPEHLEIMVREPRVWVKKVRNAGAIFIGAWTPECVGDYVAGPSHVLPTGGTAAMFSGLTTDDFRKRNSLIAYTRADLDEVLSLIDIFCRVERFDAHKRSARIRFEKS